ncbi:MAG: hypothetical protein II916_03580 [Oscillospiraceae bacterium]|nr:hypothetical protein [Oscillospiraceae bacterium]
MSNRAKLLLSVLFIAAIILCVGLTRFYFDVTKNTAGAGQDDKVESIVRSFGDMHVFKNASGLCGVVDGDGTIVIEPEWVEILDVTPDLVVVSSRVRDKILIGGVDYEENVVLPFVYRSITELGGGYLAATVAADDSVILYDTSYQLAFASAYDEVSYEKDVLRLKTDNCTFVYSDSSDKPVLTSAEMECPVGKVSLQWRLSNRVYLQQLSEADLLRINRGISEYMTMLIEDDFTGLPDISDTDYIAGLTRPGTMPRAKIDRLNGFSFSMQNEEIYDVAFTAAYHMAGERTAFQSVQAHLLFRRGANNKMLLTSVNLNFRSKETPTEAQDAADAE